MISTREISELLLGGAALLVWGAVVFGLPWPVLLPLGVVWAVWLVRYHYRRETRWAEVKGPLGPRWEAAAQAALVLAIILLCGLFLAMVALAIG